MGHGYQVRFRASNQSAFHIVAGEHFDFEEDALEFAGTLAYGADIFGASVVAFHEEVETSEDPDIHPTYTNEMMMLDFESAWQELNK
jgi:hypothetical protein